MKKQCSTCGGSGQVGFFQGVSRFLITWEECPQCCGTGEVDQDNTSSGNRNSTETEPKKKSSGSKKK